MLLTIKLIILPIFCYLWYLGGQKANRYRDVGIPVILSLYFGLTQLSWIMFLKVGACSNIIRLGYGNYDPDNDPRPSFLASILKDRNGWYIRAVWGLICSLVIGLSVKISFVIAWYVLGNTLINYLVSKLRLKVLPTDILVALGIGSIIFL